MAQPPDTVDGLNRTVDEILRLQKPSPWGGREVMSQVPGVPETQEIAADIYLLNDEEERASKAFMDPVYKRWPNMKRWLPDYKVKDSRDRYARPEDAAVDKLHRGVLEHYDRNETGPPRFPGDRTNRPYVGNPTIELFLPLKQREEDVTTSIFGDMLHGLPAANPEFAELRREFGREIINDPLMLEGAVEQYHASDDPRSFQEWFERTELDAFIRGLLAPDKADDWKNVYTSELRDIGKKMTKLIETPEKDR